MGLFGKILIFVNLLLSGGFVYFSVQDWHGRQAITASGNRHILLLNGLPLKGGPDTLPPRQQPSSDGYSDFVSEVIPFVIEGPGHVRTTSISPELLYAYFGTPGDVAGSLASGGPVASQQVEVKRVYAILKGQDSATRMQIIPQALLRLAQSFEERTDYRDWQGSKSKEAELMHAMDLQFHRVLPEVVEAGPLNPEMWNSLDSRLDELKTQRDAAAKAAEAAKEAGNAAEATKKEAEAGTLTGRIERLRKQPPQDEADRKFRLARLLVLLETSAPWQKRCALVVGLKQYVKAVGGQSDKFRDILTRVEQATIVDQSRFVGEYSQLRTLAIERTLLVLSRAEIRAQLTVQAQKDQDLVNQRTLQRDDLIALRTALKAEVDVLLAKQTITERHLFLVEREIGLKLEDIYRLEAELRRLENARYEQKK